MDQCVRSGILSADRMAALEAAAGPDVRKIATDRLHELYTVHDAAKKTSQSRTVPEGMWHWRINRSWRQVPEGGASDAHDGMDGC